MRNIRIRGPHPGASWGLRMGRMGDHPTGTGWNRFPYTPIRSIACVWSARNLGAKYMQRNVFLFFAIAFLGAGVGWCASDDLDSYIQHEMETQKIPGVVFAIIDHGKIVTERAYGLANLETGTPLRSDGVFEIASVTKPFTATAIMMLVEDGKIGLDDPISKFMAQVPPAWREITVRQLLSHTSGISGMGWVESGGSPLLEISTQRHFDELAKLPLQFNPGERCAYSDSGYFLLGMIIERVSGMRYAEFMQKRVFAPSGMTTTSILDRRAIIKNHVSEYTLHDAHLEQERRVWQHELPSYFGMLSTVDDTAKWMIALTAGHVVNHETLNQMWTGANLKDGSPALIDGMPYGLGWFTGSINGHRVIGHPGFLGSAIFEYVDDEYGVIVFTNLDTSSGKSHQVVLAQGIVSRLRPDLPRFLP
jgi:D-alanyl-D-alanine carboxypeptidase